MLEFEHIASSNSNTIPRRIMKRITEANATFGVFLAFLVIPMSGLATDIYLPSLPSIAVDLHATPHAVQFSLTLFLIGYGLGQLFIGNLLDSYGRYPGLLISLFLVGLTSEAIALTDSVAALNALRLLQGLLVAVSVVAKRAFFVDVFEGFQLRRFLASVTIVWSMGPIVAPFIGGYLQTGFGWRANFHFLAIFAWAVMVLEVWKGGETLREPHAFHMPSILKRYREVVTHGPFIRGVINVGLPYASVLSFSMVAPFIIEHLYGFNPHVTGFASLAMGLAWMTGGFIARSQMQRSLIDKHGHGVAVMLVVAAVMLAVSWRFPNVYTLVAFAFLVHVACGAVFNVYFAECLGMFPKFAGLSGGLTGGMAFMLTSSLSSAAVVGLHVQTQRGLATVYLAFALALAGMWILGRRSVEERRPTEEAGEGPNHRQCR